MYEVCRNGNPMDEIEFKKKKTGEKSKEESSIE